MQQTSICRADPSSLTKKGGKGVGTYMLSSTERREEEGRRKKEQLRVEQDAEQRAEGVLDISENLKPIRSEGVG